MSDEARALAGETELIFCSALTLLIARSGYSFAVQNLVSIGTQQKTRDRIKRLPVRSSL
jgi:hypothetical protein